MYGRIERAIVSHKIIISILPPQHDIFHVNYRARTNFVRVAILDNIELLICIIILDAFYRKFHFLVVRYLMEKQNDSRQKCIRMTNRSSCSIYDYSCNLSNQRVMCYRFIRRITQSYTDPYTTIK